MNALPESKTQPASSAKALSIDRPVVTQIEQSSKTIEKYFDEKFDEKTNRFINISTFSAIGLYLLFNIVTVDIN